MFAAIALVASAVLGAFKGRAEAKSQAILSKAQYESNEIIRQGQNEFNAAKFSFEAYERSSANRELLREGGEQYNSLNNQIMEVMRQATSGRFSASLSASAQMGALSAIGGLTGVTSGATAQMLQSASRFQSGAKLDDFNQQATSTITNGKMKLADVMPSAINQMDGNLYLSGVNSVEGVDWSKTMKTGSVFNYMDWGKVLQGVGMAGDAMTAAAPTINTGAVSNKVLHSYDSAIAGSPSWASGFQGFSTSAGGLGDVSQYASWRTL